MTRFTPAFTLLLALSGCPQCPHSTPATNDASVLPARCIDTNGDSGVNDESLDAAHIAFPICAKACSVLIQSHCPEGDKQDGGDSCYAICAHAEGTGGFGLRPECIAAKKPGDVVGIRSCGTVRCLGK